MIHLQKLRIPSVLKWVSLDLSGTNNISSRQTFWTTSYRFYGRKKSAPSENGSDFNEIWTWDRKIAAGSARAAWQEAQAALLDYLHYTRDLQFMDAEHISRNSPHFLQRLLGNVKNDTEIGQSVARFLRYHPINEFEAFFESIGLKPSEYDPILPRNLMFLNDDMRLLENYQVLCSYGIARKCIGRIYKEATEVFKFDHGVLQSKLQSFEDMGLNQSTIINFISSSPNLLIVKNREFKEVLEKFKRIGVEYGWVVEHMLEGSTFNCNMILELLCLFNNMGCGEEQLRELIFQHPGFLFEASGKMAFSIIGFLLKFGSTKTEICSMFLQFPQLQARKFLCNLRQCYHFLVEIDMDPQEVGKIVRSHPIFLGSCSFKKLNGLMAIKQAAKRRICHFIQENPQILQDLDLGTIVKRLSKLEEQQRLEVMKTKFLLDVGFVENSNEMRKAMTMFRGNGGELQERFDCFVNAGLQREDVLKMIKVAPHVLNQTKDLIQTKINFVINGLGYPLSSLVAFPQCVSYTIQRVKLRFSMCDWLKGQGKVDPKLAMCTVLTCTDKVFIKRYVDVFPGGPEVWKKLKKQIYPD